jgi:aromatic ring-opening dioxygenase catalytic subunit (LigB family)
MRFVNRTSAALVSSLFLRPNLPICSINQANHSSSMSAPVISVCHGGGPLPIMGDPEHAELIKSMSEKVPKILGLGTPNAPRAIVLITAHWSERRPTISNGKKHSLYFDYGGFPKEAYEFKYDAPGSPEVAKEVFDLLEKAGMNPAMDSHRGT